MVGGASLTATLGALRAGAVPLAEAFWWYGIAYGLLVNALATMAAFALIALDAPGWVAIVVHMAPLPYNLLVLVGVWRSAANRQGAPGWGGAARIGIAVWFAAVTVL